MSNKIKYNKNESRWELLDSLGIVLDYAEGMPTDNPGRLQWGSITISVGSSIDTTAEPSDILSGVTAVSKGEKIVGTMPNRGSISYTPSTNSLVAEGGYYSSIYVEGDPDLKAENIKSGVTIFNVTGILVEEDNSIDLSVVTAKSSDVLEGATFVDSTGATISGSIRTVEPSVNDNVVTIPNGYIGTESTVTVGTEKNAETYTPGTEDLVIESGAYLKGDQTIKGDSNLRAENIAEGVTIFGTVGTHKEGADVSSVTATPESVLSGVTFVDNTGSLKTGSIASVSPSLSGNVFTIDKGYVEAKVTSTVPEMTISNDGEKITVPVGYNKTEQEFTIGATGADVSGVTATANEVLASVKFVDNTGSLKSGNIPTVTPSVSGGTFTVGKGYVANNTELSVPTMGDPTVFENIVTIPAGYNESQWIVHVRTASEATVSNNVVTIHEGYNYERDVVVGTAVSAKTYTPGTTDQAIASGSYLSGVQTIKGDSNLVASNIKAGTSIFNVSGTFTADATATANDIATGKTAYVNGQLVTGTYVEQPSASEGGFSVYECASLSEDSGWSGYKVEWSEGAPVNTAVGITVNVTTADEGANGDYRFVDPSATGGSRVLTMTNSNGEWKIIWSGDRWDIIDVTGDHLGPGMALYYTASEITEYATLEDLCNAEWEFSMAGDIVRGAFTVLYEESVGDPGWVKSDTLTEGLSIVGFTPSVGSVYNENTTALVYLHPDQPTAEVIQTTATAGDILSGKTAVLNGELVTGTIGTVTASKSSNTVTVPVGYIKTEQTIIVGTPVSATTYTPGTTDQTIVADSYISGVQTIKGDSNLKPENIAQGVTIFGVTGNHSGDGSNTGGGSGSMEFYRCASVVQPKVPVGFTVNHPDTDWGSAHKDEYLPLDNRTGANRLWIRKNDLPYINDEGMSFEAIGYDGSKWLIGTTYGVNEHPSASECTAISNCVDANATMAEIAAATWDWSVSGGGTYSDRFTITEEWGSATGWSGYKCTYDAENGELTQDATLTTGLTCDGFTPRIGKVYSIDSKLQATLSSDPTGVGFYQCSEGASVPSKITLTGAATEGVNGEYVWMPISFFEPTNYTSFDYYKAGSSSSDHYILQMRYNMNSYSINIHQGYVEDGTFYAQKRLYIIAKNIPKDSAIGEFVSAINNGTWSVQNGAVQPGPTAEYTPPSGTWKGYRLSQNSDGTWSKSDTETEGLIVGGDDMTVGNIYNEDATVTISGALGL